MTIVVRRPATWLELQDMLFDEPWPARADPYHSGLIHRGVRDSTWQLRSSVERQELFPFERHLLRNFVKYSESVRIPRGRSWEWLALAQHHGLPTRLMDWTYSPLVALHFATVGQSEEPGTAPSAVWSLDYVKVHERLPTAISDALTDGAGAFTTEMLDDAAVSPVPVGGQDVDDAYMIVMEPPSIDARIVNQYAGLSFFSSTTVNVQDWLDGFAEPVAAKIEIAPALRAEAREKLDKANINERVIYPGLDGLSAWLTRYYSSGERHWVRP